MKKLMLLALVGAILLIGQGCKKEDSKPVGAPDPGAKMETPPPPPKLPPK
jgi:hypothetical protein